MSRSMGHELSPFVLLMLIIFLFTYRTAFSQESLAPCPLRPVKAEGRIKSREESRNSSAIKTPPGSNIEQPKLNESVFLAHRYQCKMSPAQPLGFDNRTASLPVLLSMPPGGRGANGGSRGQVINTSSSLTANEKFKYGLRAAFLRPEAYILTGVSAAITQATERDQPQKTAEDQVADGLSRFAIKFGTRSTKALLGSGLYPVIFDQDPRYKPSHKKGFGPRALYAASRVFVTESDNRGLGPNYSRLGGNMSASALANVWERSTPGRDRIGLGPTFSRFGTTTGFDVLSFVVFKEFWPDIKRKVFKR